VVALDPATGTSWIRLTRLATGQEVRSRPSTYRQTKRGDTLKGWSSFKGSEGKRYTFVSNGYELKFDTTKFKRSVFVLNGGEEFELLQYHFHSPSEHHIDGLYFPMELHMVFKSQTSGDMAVLGTLYSVGADDDPFLAQFWDLIPRKYDPDEEFSSRKEISFDHFTNEVNFKRYYNYVGSLTTPPCRYLS